MFRRRRSVSPSTWRPILSREVELWSDLDASDQALLLERMARFVPDHRWEGVGGQEITPAVHAVVAAHACLLALRFEGDPYRNVRSIVVYPSTVVRRGRRSLGGGIEADGPMAIHGETRAGGPVVVVWNAASTGSRHPERGRNVVLHEFAHQLDVFDGVVDGMPLLASRTEELEWQETLGAVYDRIVAEPDPVLGRYAATNRGELFAVATERFFTRPRALAANHPELFALLRSFYRQDPVLRRPG